MANDVSMEMGRREEIAAAKRRQEKEKKVQERLVLLIKKYQIKMKLLEDQIAKLWQKEQQLISRKKNFQAKIVKWRRERKQARLDDLKKVTPSIKSR